MDLFGLYICFTISDHVMFPWEFSFCLFISYAYMCTCISNVKLFPRVASHSVKFENKMCKLKSPLLVQYRKLCHDN